MHITRQVYGTAVALLGEHLISDDPIAIRVRWDAVLQLRMNGSNTHESAD